MSEVCRNQFFLNGYISSNMPEAFMRNKTKYTIQRYQGEHKNEFRLRSQKGDVYLFENNVLKQKWKENEKKVKSEEFTVYKNGRVYFTQRFDDILDHRDSYRTVYHKRGLRMEIWSAKTGHLMYHGEYNDDRKREGWGIEYDEESGNMVVEGIWNNGELIEVIRCFNGDTMTELKRNGEDSLDPVKRIPIYVGGFRYDEDNETFVREGVGCLIDANTGIATRESEWKDGKEVSGVKLIDGKFDYQQKPARQVMFDVQPAQKHKRTPVAAPKHEPNLVPIKVNIAGSSKLNEVNLQVIDLVISSNSCNDLNALDLNRFKCLRSIEIGDDCFESDKN